MLTDKDPCPVNGQHNGTPMEKVPAQFLLWVADQPWCQHKYPEVLEYVNKYRRLLEDEAEEEER